MTRGSWLLLAGVGIIVTAFGGALVGGGQILVGTVLVFLGAPTFGVAVGRSRRKGPPLT